MVPALTGVMLQPIFESPDINKQLPTEGKKFATVDKNWRMTISAAKGGVTKVGRWSASQLVGRGSGEVAQA